MIDAAQRLCSTDSVYLLRDGVEFQDTVEAADGRNSCAVCSLVWPTLGICAGSNNSASTE